MRVLLVEDDPLLGSGVQTGLRQNGYAVDWVKDGMAALSALDAESYDLAVLDVGLPGMSGLEVLTKLRESGQDIPVIILTARDTIDDRIKGLDLGADDYLVKPFDLDELTARIRALLRRSYGRSNPMLCYGPLELDPSSMTVRRDGDLVKVSRKEFTILHTLLENQGKLMSRQKLEESLYSWKDDVDSNTIEVHIHHLRKKMPDGLIRTVRGIGYIIDNPQ